MTTASIVLSSRMRAEVGVAGPRSAPPRRPWRGWRDRRRRWRRSRRRPGVDARASRRCPGGRCRSRRRGRGRWPRARGSATRRSGRGARRRRRRRRGGRGSPHHTGGADEEIATVDSVHAPVIRRTGRAGLTGAWCARPLTPHILRLKRGEYKAKIRSIAGSPLCLSRLRMSSCTPRPPSRSSKRPPRPRRWSSGRRRSAIRRSPCSTVTGVYGAPRFHMAARKAGLKAIVGAELTIRTQQHAVQPASADALAAAGAGRSREGYRNLCRLITRMKAGAPKGEVTDAGGALSARGSRRRHRGLIALAGRAVLGGARHGVGGLLDRLVGVFGRDRLYVELQRHLQRDEEADNQALVTLAVGLPRAARRDQRRPLRDAGGAPAARRPHLHPPQDRRRPRRAAPRCTTPSAT